MRVAMRRLEEAAVEKYRVIGESRETKNHAEVELRKARRWLWQVVLGIEAGQEPPKYGAGDD